MPAVFDRNSNSFIKIYFDIPEGREDELAHSSIRFTMGRFTTEEEIDYVLSVVRDQVDRLRELLREVRLTAAGAAR